MRDDENFHNYSNYVIELIKKSEKWPLLFDQLKISNTFS